MRSLIGLLAALGLLIGVAGTQAAEPKPAAIDYQRDIQPILASTCYACHSEVKIRGGLRVDSLEAILKGGSHGPAVVPGKGAESLLVKKSDESDPTPHKGRVLTAGQISLLKAWIDQGVRPLPGPVPDKK